MKTLAVKKYIGDDELLGLLRKDSYPGTIDRIKACILGVQCSLHQTGPAAVIDFIHSEACSAPSDYSASAIEGLWYHLYGSADFPKSEHIRFSSETTGRDSCISFVRRQLEAGEEFLKRLHLGGYNVRIENEKIRKVYAIFMANIELLRALENSMREKWTEEEFSDMDGFIKKLESFTSVMWSTMVTIKNMMKNEKLKLIKNKAIIVEIEERLGQPLRRNDSCPCGSGKKYKNCCGS
ncbi:MAG TPA: SEC-C metal-binding domain-containing protein [Spirochaetota bacterium]|nr:SEC-C metal-binding domain-containing protein [Spirochaetota bacterium]